jgi:hypothetical protein
MLLAIVLGCRQGSAGTASNQAPLENAPPTPGRIENVDLAANTTLPTPTPTPLPNAVCPDPAKPCKGNKDIGFDEWSITFRLPAKVQPNKTYRSAPFFAILLKTVQAGDEDLCDGGEYVASLEDERKQVQKEFPDRKVFASYGCPNMAATGYDFPGAYDAKREVTLIDNFIAVYAGQTKEEAEKVLPRVKAKYPNAEVKSMTATQEWIYQ